METEKEKEKERERGGRERERKRARCTRELWSTIWPVEPTSGTHSFDVFPMLVSSLPYKSSTFAILRDSCLNHSLNLMENILDSNEREMAHNIVRHCCHVFLYICDDYYARRAQSNAANAEEAIEENEW